MKNLDLSKVRQFPVPPRMIVIEEDIAGIYYDDEFYPIMSRTQTIGSDELANNFTSSLQRQCKKFWAGVQIEMPENGYLGITKSMTCSHNIDGSAVLTMEFVYFGPEGKKLYEAEAGQNRSPLS